MNKTHFKTTSNKVVFNNSFKRSDLPLGFAAWYKATYQKSWVNNQMPLVELIELAFEYELYCVRKNIHAVWDG